MKPLDRRVQRILLEAAVAAPNYGLLAPAKKLLETLPALNLDDEIKALTTALIYFGLGRPRAALAALHGCGHPRALALTQKIERYIDHMVSQKRALLVPHY
jgi:type III secretion system SsaH family protein